jgi:hypothetical protein
VAKKGKESPTGGRVRGQATIQQLQKRPEIKYQHGYAQLTGNDLDKLVEKAKGKYGENTRIEVGMHYPDNKIHWSYGSGQFPGIHASYLERLATRNDRSTVEQVQFDSRIQQAGASIGSPDHYVIRAHYK